MGLTGLRRKERPKVSRSKLEKRLKFYAEVKDSAVALGAKKDINKRKRMRKKEKKLKALKAYDLSALSDSLPEVAPNQFKLNSKSRHKLVLSESKRLKAVLSHPVFQSDPLAAINQYIANTQPPSPESKERPKKKVDKEKRKARKKARKLAKKNEGKGESSEHQAMAI